MPLSGGALATISAMRSACSWRIRATSSISASVGLGPANTRSWRRRGSRLSGLGGVAQEWRRGRAIVADVMVAPGRRSTRGGRWSGRRLAWRSAGRLRLCDSYLRYRCAIQVCHPSRGFTTTQLKVVVARYVAFMSQVDHVPSPSTRWVSRRLRGARSRRGLSAQALSDAIERETGMLIRRDTISNIENGRRDRVTVDELLAFAAALDISPLHLVLPDPSDDGSPGSWPFQSPDERRLTASAFREWWRGDRPLRSDDGPGDGYAQSPERRRDFHAHDLPEAVARAQAEEHPSVGMARAVRELVARAAVAEMRGEASDQEVLEDLDSALAALEKHVDLLRSSPSRRT